MALVLPVRAGVPLVFNVGLPTFLWLTLMALTYLFLTPIGAIASANHEPPRVKRVRIGVQVCFPLICLACAISAVQGRTLDVQDVFAQTGYFAIPLFFAACPRRLIPRRLDMILAVLWLVQACHGIWQYSVGFYVVGLTGNHNWMATLIVALTPWVWRAILQSNDAQGQHRPARRAGAIAVTCGLAAIGGIALFLAYQAHCRATWLVLIAYLGLFVLLPALSRLLRVTCVLAVCCTVLAVCVMWPERIAEGLERDIRPPLYKQTLHLIVGHLGLGVGPGNFRREFVKFRSVAQKRRRVAASVTEHPHNELLHIAASVGLPACLLWTLLLLPLVRRARTGPFWRAVHFSAFMIVGHALFDKTLVQPPTNLLGFMFLGLLWRPLLRCRCRPDRRTPFLNGLAVPAAVLVSTYAVTVAVRDVKMGWCFRKSRLAEDEAKALMQSGRPQSALRQHLRSYEALRRSTQISPKQIRTHAYAGICANNKLRQPHLALPHLRRVFVMDPNFAHINGEIGLAFGAMRRHSAALAFFEREGSLFPFDVLAHQRLFLGRIVTGKTDALPSLFERLADLRFRRAVHRYGREEVLCMCQRFARAVATDASTEAIAVARLLLTSVDSGAAEPAYFPLASSARLDKTFYRQPFGLADYAYWRRLWTWQRRLAGVRSESGAALVAWFCDGAVAEGDDAGLLPELLFAEIGYQCSMEVALVVDSEGLPTGVVEIRQSGRTYLARLQSPPMVMEMGLAQARHNDSVLAAFGLPVAGGDQLKLSLPVSPLDFCLRTQTLGQFLAEAFGRMGRTFGDSPALRLLRYQQLLQAEDAAQARNGVGKRDALTPAAVSIEFDPGPFRALADAASAGETGR